MRKIWNKIYFGKWPGWPIGTAVINYKKVDPTNFVTAHETTKKEAGLKRWGSFVVLVVVQLTLGFKLWGNDDVST